MTISILECNPDGHRLDYVHYIIEGHNSQSDEVPILLTTPLVVESQKWQSYEKKSATPWVFGNINSLIDVASTLAEMNSKKLIIPDGDKWLLEAIRLRLRKKIPETRILLLRTNFQPFKRVKSNLRTAVKLGLVAFCSLVPGLKVFRLVPPGQAISRSRDLEDPVQVTTSLLQHKALGVTQLQNGRDTFAIVGAIDSRKNVEALLEALPMSNRPLNVLLAGRFSPEYLEQLNPQIEMLRGNALEIVVVNRLLTEQELDSFIALADCVVTAHTNNASSGIALKALALGTPVLAAGSKALRKLIRRYSKNSYWVPLTVDSLARAIDSQIFTKEAGTANMPNPSSFYQKLVLS